MSPQLAERCPHCYQNTLKKTKKTHTDTSEQEVTVWACDGTLPATDMLPERACGYSEGRP